MKKDFLIRLILVLILASSVQVQPIYEKGSSDNIQDRLLIFEEGKYAPYKNELTQSIYFHIDSIKDKAHTFLFYGRDTYSLFLNAKLIVQKKGVVKISVDSLLAQHPFNNFIGIYAQRGIHQVRIERLSPPSAQDQNPFIRKSNYFTDFFIVSILILIISGVFFLRTNPLSFWDYFKWNKLYSFQREENTVFRITTRGNLWACFFSSFFLGLIFLVIFHYLGEQFWVQRMFPVHSAIQGIGQWMSLSIGIVILLLLKYNWILLSANLFDYRDVVRFQFPHFIRSIYSIITITSIGGILYYISGINNLNFYYYLLWTICFMLILGVISVYQKLLSLTPFHFFHLFSYLCISEIIPLTVLIKVFFY